MKTDGVLNTVGAMKRLLAVLVPVLGLLVAAPLASAATVATAQPCYLTHGFEGPSKMLVTGSGFNPGETVDVVLSQQPGGAGQKAGLSGFTFTTVAPDGTIAATMEDIIVDSESVAETVYVQVETPFSLTPQAEVPVTMAHRGVQVEPQGKNLKQVVKWNFYGFTPGAPIFGHYMSHHKAVLTHDFGTAEGSCGSLTTEAKLFPGNGPANARYKVQFDDSKKLNLKAQPRWVTTLP
jgi:hypothetical protein